MCETQPAEAIPDRTHAGTSRLSWLRARLQLGNESFPQAHAPPISGRNSGLTNSNYVYILLTMSDEAENNQHERIAAIAKHCVAKQLRWSTRIISTFYDQKMHDTGLHVSVSPGQRL